MSKIEHITTIEDLAQHFQSKLMQIQHCVQLRDAGDDPTVISMMSGLGTSLNDLSTILTLMRAELRQQRKALIPIQEMKATTLAVQSRINHAAQNIPARMPKPKPPQVEEVKENKEISMSAPRPVQTGTPRKPLSETKQNIRENKPKTKTGKAKALPTIEYLTTEEFESTPKYMKGRLTYEKANSAIEELNKAFAGKYTVLRTKRSAQNDYIKRKIVAYQEEETKDTAGLHFIRDSDVKEYSALKQDSIYRSLITVFRHCGRIREIRGGGITRYALCR